MAKELCKRLKSHYTDKLYEQNEETDQKNDTHRMLWDFEIETNDPTIARRPNPSFPGVGSTWCNG